MKRGFLKTPFYIRTIPLMCCSLFAFPQVLQGQLPVQAYADKTVYEQDLGMIADSIHMTVKIVNQADTTATLVWGSDCLYNFYIDGEWLTYRPCGHVELVVDVDSQDSLVWQYTYPGRLSPPIFSGTHTVVGEVVGYGRDTVIVEVASTMEITVGENWNMVSVPTTLADYRKTVLFPSATSEAFSFDSQYVVKDTLENGAGYWMSFPTPGVIDLGGTFRTEDTVDVREGWNIVGALSSPVSVSAIGSIPAGIATSRFYTFDSGYVAVSMLEPGGGYWVRVSQAGKLVMTSSGNIPSENRIRIQGTEVVPPRPFDR